MLNRCLLVLAALLCCVSDISAASSYTILVNNNEIHDSNGLFAVGGLTSITVTCRLDRVDPRARIILERITNGQTFSLNSYTTSYTGSYTLWRYTLNDADKQTPVSTYRCRDSGNENCPDYAQVTLYSTTQRPPPGATIPNCPPGGSSNPPPSSDPTTRPSSYTILVNNNEIHDSNELFAVRGLTSITVTCRLDRVDPRAKIVLEKITNGQTFTLSSYTTSYTDSYTLWTYTLTDADKLNPMSTYRCRDSGNENCPDYVQVTLYSTTQRPPPGATIPNCPPGGSSNPPPSSDPTTRSSHYTILVNNNEIHDSNELFAVRGLTSITVTCRLDRVDPQAKIVLEKITNGQTFTLSSYTTSYTDSYTLWTYTLTDADKLNPVSTYRCKDSGNVNCPDYVQVTLYSTTQIPPPGATIPNCPPGNSSNPPPSSDPTTRRGGTNSPRFTVGGVISTLVVFFVSLSL